MSFYILLYRLRHVGLVILAAVAFIATLGFMGHAVSYLPTGDFGLIVAEASKAFVYSFAAGTLVMLLWLVNMVRDSRKADVITGLHTSVENTMRFVNRDAVWSEDMTVLIERVRPSVFQVTFYPEDGHGFALLVRLSAVTYVGESTTAVNPMFVKWLSRKIDRDEFKTTEMNLSSVM